MLRYIPLAFLTASHWLPYLNFVSELKTHGLDEPNLSPLCLFISNFIILEILATLSEEKKQFATARTL